MSHYDSDYRPPLPPRSPRGPLVASSIPDCSHFPPPPSGSPFSTASSSKAGGVVVGAYANIYQASSFAGQHTSTPSSSTSLAPPGHDSLPHSNFAPLPSLPNKANARNRLIALPPLPPRPQPQGGGPHVNGHAGYTPCPPVPTLTPSALSPNNLTSFPPPPPGPPPMRVGSSPSTELLLPEHSAVGDISTATTNCQPQGSGGYRSKFPLPPDSAIDPEIPSSPPPAYTPLAEDGNRALLTSPLTQISETPDSVPGTVHTLKASQSCVSPLSTSYTAFPETSSFGKSHSSVSFRDGSPPKGSIPSAASVSSPSSERDSVSNPESSESLSFFPRVSPLVHRQDPIEELMQSMSISSTPAAGVSSSHTSDGNFDSPLSTPLEGPQLSSDRDDPVIAPLRPPKMPLCGAPGTSALNARSHEGQTGSQTAVPRRKPVAHYGVDPPDVTPRLTVTSCIDIPMAFVTTWYSHPAAPDFMICSRCFADHISRTQFADAFSSSRPMDGRPRMCRFSKPRVKDHIFPAVLSDVHLQPLIDYMRYRSTIPDCRGVDGVVGSAPAAAGIKWYNTIKDSIPGFLACEACYEDHACCSSSLSRFLQQHPQKQGQNDVWSCDFAMPFIQKQYEIDARNAVAQAGWNNFAFEAKSRISIPRCGQTNAIRSFGKKWFQPVAGPDGLIICAACYCDQVLQTGEESKWKVVAGLSDARDMQVRCAIGGRFNVRISMARAHEVKDFTVFWSSIKGLESHPMCEDQGITNAVWYTLPHHTEDFQICGACYATICEPLGIRQFFKRKFAVPDGRVHCCFNVAHPRMRFYMPRLLELYFTHDPKALVEYANRYAGIAPCSRDEERKRTKWYGWDDCKICTECYQDFARHHPLAPQMALKNSFVSEGSMCDMYSARMRELYLSCCQKSPPDIHELLQFARHRRQVYFQTVPQIKQMIQQQKLALTQQKTLNSMSNFYTNSGQLQQTSYGSPYTYSAPGLGTFATMDGLQGAAYRQQAMGIMTGAQGSVGMVKILEQQWRAVE